MDAGEGADDTASTDTNDSVIADVDDSIKQDVDDDTVPDDVEELLDAVVDADTAEVIEDTGADAEITEWTLEDIYQF